jgi:hypothetical protein
MADPQFIPSGLPHSVEMPDGSSLAKSKSRKLEDDVRRTEDTTSKADEIMADQVILRARDMPGAQTPRTDGFERAAHGKALPPVQKLVLGGGASFAQQSAKVTYDTAMVDMDFPARFIQLKIDNDKVRAQLQVLESRLGEDN